MNIHPAKRPFKFISKSMDHGVRVVCYEADFYRLGDKYGPAYGDGPNGYETIRSTVRADDRTAIKGLRSCSFWPELQKALGA